MKTSDESFIVKITKNDELPMYLYVNKAVLNEYVYLEMIRSQETYSNHIIMRVLDTTYEGIGISRKDLFNFVRTNHVPDYCILTPENNFTKNLFGAFLIRASKK